MTFWLTFIQSLPTISLPEELETEINFKTETSTQTEQVSYIETIETIQPTPTLAQLGSIPFVGIIGGIGVLLFLLLISIFIYTRFYVIAPTNEALVIAGGVIQKSKKVVKNGGCIVIPGFHEVTRVPLKEISIDVIRSGNLAVRTQDYLRANMRVTFYVCISDQEQDILTAAARLSENGKISDANIKKAIDNRADDAIRAAAKQKKMAEIDSNKIDFADTVLNLIQDDLKRVGLTLNNIAISEIEESDTYNENDYFDAQGVRLRTETIQKSIQQKTEVELATRVAIEAKQLEAEKQSLAIAQEKENANLTQQKEVEFLRAQQQREIDETKAKEAAKMEKTRILQEQAVEEENIQQKLAVQQKQIAANIALEEQNKQFKVAQTLQQQEAEVAEITRQKTLEEEKIQQQLAIQQRQIEANIALEEQNKQLKVAQALQQQESEVAEVTRKKTIQASNLHAKAEVAAAQQQSEIAQQQAAIAIANKEKERLEAEAEKAEAESAVITAKEVEAAERQRKLSLIVAEREAQEKRIADQNVVEIDVFRRRRQAEIARQAAELEAESIRTLADANKYKDLAEAEGKQALIQAENALSTANRTADLIKAIWPDLAPQLPSLLQALAPQPGVLGDARIYSFPGLNGQNGNGASNGDISKLLLSTSGITLLNSLLDEGKLGNVVTQVKNLLSTEAHPDIPNLSQPMTSHNETETEIPNLSNPSATPSSPITDTEIDEQINR
jgi:uncharacterized membrane protein YqiK